MRAMQHAIDRRRATASGRLWGLDWTREVDWDLDGITVRIGTFDDAFGFMEEHYAAIFRGGGADARFLAEPMTESKRRFCEDMDVFVMRDGGRMVGLLTGHPSDWSTYYWRTVALVPGARDRHVLTRVAERVGAPLAAVGVARMETETAPTNFPMLRMLMGLGWVVTSTVNSERWGSVLRFTKFLDAEVQGTFARQFCALAVQPRPLSVVAPANDTPSTLERRLP